ncbi:MAG: hypothetical protein LBD59_04250 [Prevotellaceae bacterium]|nr:hypothetical protein [Prevotellaceae bacterium]
MPKNFLHPVRMHPCGMQMRVCDDVLPSDASRRDAKNRSCHANSAAVCEVLCIHIMLRKFAVSKSFTIFAS